VVPEVKKHATVLVADDNAVNLKVACAMLLKLGYEVQTATDGREAVTAIAHAMATGARIDAILMDVNMPDVDGLEATRQIQAGWGTDSPPIIALTAAASAEDRERCYAAGMNDYLTKPLQVAALAQTLEKWIGGEEQPPPAPPAPDVPAGDAPVLMDFARLEEFKEYDDEALTMTREVIALFVADAPNRLAAIAQAVSDMDATSLAKAAHALKGAASNIGAVALHHAAGALEQAAKAGWPADAPARQAELEDLWEKTRPALTGWA
jgi:CheY-like chemotaxis protein/HPt (histidine-containing phosphotransfer) domain-containing protein